MPDDYFNQQERQRAPRYAAGSDMDSIKTGQEIRYSSGNGGGDFSGKTVFIIIVLICLTILFFVASSQRGVQPEEQSEETAITGTVEGEITDFFCSSDGSKATIQTVVTNNTNGNIHHIELTLTIKDTDGNTLAEKIISHPGSIIPTEQVAFTEVLDLPEEARGTTIYASMNAKYKHSTN